MKKRIVIISIFIIILISLFISIFLITRTSIEQMTGKSMKEETSKGITWEYYGWKEEKAEVLVTFVDNEDAISKVESPDGRIVNIAAEKKE